MLNVKNYVAIFVVALLFMGCQGDASNDYPKLEGEITWIDIATAEAISNEEEKMYFIDMYTDWCGWCKVMDRNTFTDEVVISYMDEKFHSIKFDAEQREKVAFDGKEFEWRPRGRNGANMLAVELLAGQMSFPSYVILDVDKKPIKVVRGYLPPEKFLSQMNNILN